MNLKRQIYLIDKELEYLHKQKKDLTILKAMQELRAAKEKIRRQQNVQRFIEETNGDWLNPSTIP